MTATSPQTFSSTCLCSSVAYGTTNYSHGLESENHPACKHSRIVNVINYKF